MHVKPARVKESAVSLECEVRIRTVDSLGILTYHTRQLFQSQDIFPDGGTVPSATLVLGRVRYVHVRNSVLQPDGLRADPAKLRPISRIGGPTYARLGEGFNLHKPEWSDVKRVLEATSSNEYRGGEGGDIGFDYQMRRDSVVGIAIGLRNSPSRSCCIK